MAWEWSHTNEAYAAAQEQVEQLSKTRLLVILREWSHKDRDDRTGNEDSSGFRLANGLRGLTQDLLADIVWRRAEEQRTCDNGGWNAWVCPYGCHTVPFDYPADKD